jgi:hypothetical protein
MALDREKVREAALAFSWEISTRQFPDSRADKNAVR